MIKFFAALYLNLRFFGALAAIIVVFILAFPFPILFIVGKIALLALLLFLLVDILYLFKNKGIEASRSLAERLSNGDDNTINLEVENLYPFETNIEILDETPPQFQWRDFSLKIALKPQTKQVLTYFLRPVKRGEYIFGALNVYASTKFGLVSRRYRFQAEQKVPVYPSYLQVRKYEIYAISNRLTELGVKKIRKIGQNMEFEQIREYVQGDDYRSLNWKATARKNHLMVNQYTDEKSQQIFSVIDKGRVMKSPFEGMTLLDYAINSALVLSNIAVRKSDKAGLITFNTKVSTMLPANNRRGQMSLILENLYNQKTNYKESDYENLFLTIRQKVKQRSLLLLYTNFETYSSLERQLPYLRNLAQKHLLVVIFFENTELNDLLHLNAKTTEDIYLKTIGEKFIHDKLFIVKELKKYGIHAILSSPQNLTVSTINKYLELKARNLI